MKHLVIIGAVFPEPSSTAAGTRMLQLIELFQELGYKVTFLSAAAVSEYSEIPTDIDFQQIGINDSAFELLIKKLAPDVVLFDRFMTEEQFGWKISEICPEAVKILDSEDLHFLRKARETVYKTGEKLNEVNLISDIFKREAAAILRCDLTLIISEFEMNLLLQKFNFNPQILHYLPIFAIPETVLKPFGERRNFMSIGNFLHEPNWQTVLKLKKYWPQIRTYIPDATLHIYGAYAPQKALQLHNEREGFLIKGRAKNAAGIFMESRVLLAPIPFGAGIKGKLLESMRFGTPNVTTEIGAEGMPGNMPWNGFICDRETDFIEKSVLLYQNENFWNNAQKDGVNILKERFKKDDFIEDFAKKLQNLRENLPQHRRQNFLGQILQHHSLQSTRYLGKWIEEKNKNV